MSVTEGTENMATEPVRAEDLTAAEKDSTPDPKGTAPDAGRQTVRRVLQRFVLPTDRDTDVLPLYIDAEPLLLDVDNTRSRGVTAAINSAMSAQNVSTGNEVHPDAILGRHSLRVEASQRLSLGTYFNAFPAGYWRRWTVVDMVTLRVTVKGKGATVIVYRSMANGRSQRADSAETTTDEAETFTFDLTLKPFADGGWYWFDVIAGDDAVVIESAEWSAMVSEDRAEVGTATIGITTMNRPDFCAKLVGQMGDDEYVLSLLDEILVVDQGTQKVTDSEYYAQSAKKVEGKLRVIEQGNIGGSGGFARAQLETMQANKSTYVLFLDDDIEAEPESILRALTFGDLARVPTIVGGHMFSLYSKSQMHSFGEVIDPWKFWWNSPPPVMPNWDFGNRNLRSTRWLHKRIDVDFTPWYFCLIPMKVVRDVGLSLPLFIKWDDSEYGVRAQEAGYPTVTFPGSAVWHIPWTDKNDALDWQAYFHQRNRWVAALLHSRYPRGGRMVQESLNHQIRHLVCMQYSVVEMRHKALEDVLAGPDRLHDDLPTKLKEVRELRKGFSDAQVIADPDAFPPVKREKPPKRGRSVTFTPSRIGLLKAAGAGTLRQFRKPRDFSRRYPELGLAAMDNTWWALARLDSAVVSMPDGTGAALYQRDPEKFRELLAKTVAIHQRLAREWPKLSKHYRARLSDVTSPQAWEKTFAAAPPEPAVEKPKGTDG